MLLDAQAVGGRLNAYRRAPARARRAPRQRPPGLLARAGARMRTRALDRALIDGADPAVSPQLAAHAARITSTSGRCGLAGALDRLARSEREASNRFRVLPHRGAIRANASELQALAALLRGSSAVNARGVAHLRLLVTDGAGPTYTDRIGHALAAALDEARVAAAA